MRGQIVAKSRQTTFRLIDGRHPPAGGSELASLAAGCRAQIQDMARPCAEQACRQRRRDVLHPPAAVGEAGQVGDRARIRNSDMKRRQRLANRRGHVAGAQRQVERRWCGKGAGCRLDRRLAPCRTPAGGGVAGQRRPLRQCRAATRHRAEHAMDQTLRPAIDQRQHRRDRRMGRCAERQRLHQRDPEREARLGVVGQALAGLRVDQRVEIGQPPQRLGRDRMCQAAVGTMYRARRCRQRRLQCLAPAQHRIEQPQRRAARGGTQRLGGGGGCMAGWSDRHGRPMWGIEPPEGTVMSRRPDHVKPPAHLSPNPPVPKPALVEPKKRRSAGAQPRALR